MASEKENASKVDASEAVKSSSDARTGNKDSASETPSKRIDHALADRDLCFGELPEATQSEWRQLCAVPCVDDPTRGRIDEPEWDLDVGLIRFLASTELQNTHGYAAEQMHRVPTVDMISLLHAHDVDGSPHEKYAITERYGLKPRLLSDAYAKKLIAAAAPEAGSWEAQLVQALADVQSHLGTGAQPRVRTRPLFVPALELVARPKPPKPWLVNSLITEGTTTQIAGVPKTTKSWLLTEVAVAVASGTKVCGHFPTGAPKRVAYFYAEDHERDVCAHLLALVAGRGMDPAEVLKNLHIEPRGEFIDVTRDEDLALIVASCRAMGKVDLLCLDPLRDIHSNDENDSNEMSPVMRRLRLLGELLGCSVAFVHHMNKGGAESGSGQPGQQSRGSGAIHGSTDCGIYMQDLKGDGIQTFTTTVTSQVKGARSAGSFDLTLEIQDDANGSSVHAAWTVSKKVAKADKKAESTEAILVTDRLRVIAFVRAQAATGEYFTAAGLRDVVGIPDSRTRVAVNAALLTGDIKTAEFNPMTHMRPTRGKWIVPK